MKIVKCVLGSICLALAGFEVALLLGAADFGGLKFPRDLPFVFCTCWLVGTGVFLLVRRNLPLSGNGRMLAILNLCLCAVFLIFAVVPNFIQAHQVHAANPCVNNLRQIDAAANQFALEHNLPIGAAINFPDDLTPYIKLDRNGKIHSCPDGGIYHISKVGDKPTCSLGTTVTPAHALP